MTQCIFPDLMGKAPWRTATMLLMYSRLSWVQWLQDRPAMSTRAEIPDTWTRTTISHSHSTHILNFFHSLE